MSTGRYRKTVGVAAALGIGAVGAGVATMLNVPLAMLVGALMATLIVSLSGIDITMPSGCRSALQPVLGAFLAGEFTPEILSHVQLWPLTLMAVPVAMAVASTLSAIYLVRVAQLDRVTSVLSSIPGGLLLMATIGGTLGGDERRIAVAQAIRLILTVVSVAVALGFWQGMHREQAEFLAQDWNANPAQLLALIVLATFGAVTAQRLRMPSAGFFGPILILAPLYLTGVLTVAIPGALIAVALWVLGTSIGSHFYGFGLTELLRVGVHSVVSVTLLMLVSLLSAWGLSALMDIPFLVLFLAFAPGGVAEMSMIALTLDANPAFVTAHHFLRIVVCLVFVPWLAFHIKHSGTPHQ